MTDAHKPRYRMAGGKIVRMGWPTVVEYEITEGPQAGEVTPYMPTGGDTFRLLIHDLAEYERMAATGWFRDPRHTGVPPAKFIDQRRAPGG